MSKNPLENLLAFFILFLFTNTCKPQSELTAEQVYDIVNQSVVMIISTENNGNEDQGSGVVIMDGGYIATCNHLIENSTAITVKHQNLEFKNAEIVAQDVQRDIAIIKISAENLTPIKVADSDILKPGQQVYTISSPVGYENTISEGIVSGLRKDKVKTTLIQSTAPITEGSSGGALINSNGELIGLLSSGKHEGSLYFSIPVNEIRTVFDTNSYGTNEQKSGNEDYGKKLKSVIKENEKK
jgi:serine protease Do